MKYTSTRCFTSGFAIILLIAIDGFASPLAAAELSRRQYDTSILESAIAEAIVWQQCKESSSPCSVVNTNQLAIIVEADARTLGRISAALATAQQVPRTQTFQVTMIEAANNGDHGLGNVPEPARAALADARGFLPFNGYRLLGTTVLRTDKGASAILNGPGDTDYNCSLSFHHAVTHDGHQLVIRHFSLQRMPPKGDNGQYLEGASAVDILSTSFAMTPGETVVVGTSKLEGPDQALVVLLTAVTP